MNFNKAIGLMMLAILILVAVVTARDLLRNIDNARMSANLAVKVAEEIRELRIKAETDAAHAYRSIDQMDRIIPGWVSVRGRAVDQTGGPAYPCFLASRDTLVSVQPDGSFDLPVKQGSNGTVEVWIAHPWFNARATNINVLGHPVVYATRLQ